MKLFSPSKLAITATGVAVAVTLSAGIAFAVWTSPAGDGNGSATGYTAVKADITARVANTADLFPGSSVTGTVTITNTNPYAIKVTALTKGAGNVVDGTCLADTVNATNQSVAAGIPQTNTTVPIAAGGTGVYSVTFSMISTADNACQGKSFLIPLTVASQSSGF
ncbi:MAG: hypothetical protein QOF60_2577 [Actinomycetota bacterium]|jgi:hypothetical protein|nr:hypothetical protein [Actinomycetota bacterium]